MFIPFNPPLLLRSFMLVRPKLLLHLDWVDVGWGC